MYPQLIPSLGPFQLNITNTKSSSQHGSLHGDAAPRPIEPRKTLQKLILNKAASENQLWRLRLNF
jgi:hypothetical protein